MIASDIFNAHNESDNNGGEGGRKEFRWWENGSGLGSEW